MIRVNLLPTAAKKTGRSKAVTAGGGGAGWAVAYFIVAAGWIAALAVLYIATSGQVEEQQAQNARVTQHIERLRSKAGDIDALKKELGERQELAEVVDRLQRAKLGPTRIVKELTRVLSVGGMPTVDPGKLEKMREDNPLAGFNTSWDVRRLWLLSFEEEGRECKIRGRGRTNEDVAEFLRRLHVSEYFTDVTLEKTEAEIDEQSGLSVIEFLLSCKVRY